MKISLFVSMLIVSGFQFFRLSMDTSVHILVFVFAILAAISPLLVPVVFLLMFCMDPSKRQKEESRIKREEFLGEVEELSKTVPSYQSPYCF